jgi:stage II sporulation protein D
MKLKENSSKRIVKILILIIILTFIGCGTESNIIREREEKREKEPIIIRVAVEKNSQKFELISNEAYLLYKGARSILPPQIIVELKEEYVNIDEEQYQYPVFITGQNNVLINGTYYYGDLELIDAYVINKIPLEEYLKGVLSSEMADSWPIEALKTQAVVSRTYAFKRLIKNMNEMNEIFDIEDTESHQKFVYVENNARVNEAIDETQGIVVLFQGDPIEAFFHSSSGGITENCRDIFQQDLPYLQSIPDPYSMMNEQGSWTFALSEQEIKRSLIEELGDRIDSLSLKDVEIYGKTKSGRVKEFALTFEGNKKIKIKGNTFRIALDSTRFKSLLIQEIQSELVNNEYVYTFFGKGYGHGVGLSQWGAKMMAEQGFSFKQIIAFYYRGTQLGNYNVIR